MMKPKSIREAEAKMTEETKAVHDKAGIALFDKTLTDEAADAIILASNAALTAAGMPSGGLTLTRAVFRAAWPNMGV
jgi:hypothetical protein